MFIYFINAVSLLSLVLLASARPSQRAPPVNSDVVDNFRYVNQSSKNNLNVTKPNCVLSRKGSNIAQLKASVQRPRRYATGHNDAIDITTKNNNTNTFTSSNTENEEVPEKTALKDEGGGQFFNQKMDIDIESYLGPEMTWPIDNNLFQGSLCILIRDHPRCDYDFDNETDVYFELQIQGRFKRMPKGPLYICLEVPEGEKIKISWPLRTFLKTAVAFMKNWGYSWVNLSFGRGKEVPPQISSPAFQAFDRLVITPSGEKPPRLGHAIPNCNENTIQRKALAFDHRICMNSTYTLSLNHTYVDIVDWRVNGIPLVKSFEFTFTNAMRLVMYEVEDGSHDTKGNINAIAKTKHHRKRDVVFWITFQREFGKI